MLHLQNFAPSSFFNSKSEEKNSHENGSTGITDAQPCY